jgi:hypothetical protein
MEANRNWLLSDSKKTVKLMRQLKRINFCVPAFDDTMVLLGEEKKQEDQNNVILLLHVNRTGIFLLERPYESTF